MSNLKMNNNFDIDILQICRTCMKVITDVPFCYLDSTPTANTQLTIKQMLHTCIPELNLSIISSAVICCKCVDNLLSVYEFKKNCLQLEMQINKYIQDIQHTGDLNIVEVVRFYRPGMEDLEITKDFKNEDLVSETSAFNQASECTDSFLQPNIKDSDIEVEMEDFEITKDFKNEDLVCNSSAFNEASECTQSTEPKYLEIEGKMRLNENTFVLINKLMDFGVLPKKGSVKCTEGHICALVPLQRNVDGYCWRCRSTYVKNKKKRRRCDFMQTLRKNTFFEKSHLTLKQIYAFVNLWCQGGTLDFIIFHTNISTRTAVRWAYSCREVVEYFLIKNKKRLGGPGTIVEINDSKFGRRKYHRGHRVQGQWVFSGIQQETGDYFLVPTQDRTSETLIALIKEWILPGTSIILQCWKAHDALQESDFNRLRITHSINFVDEEMGAHTNIIESSLPGCSQKKNLFSRNLAKFIFLKRCKMLQLDPIEEFFKWAGHLYNPLEEVVEHSTSKSSDEEDYDEVDVESLFI